MNLWCPFALGYPSLIVTRCPSRPVRKTHTPPPHPVYGVTCLLFIFIMTEVVLSNMGFNYPIVVSNMER